MRLRAEAPRLAAVCASIWLLLGTGSAAQTSPAAPQPDAQTIADALEKVRNDPNLATERTLNTLRWITRPQTRSALPQWIRWIQGFARWLGRSARTLVWVALGFLIAWLAFHAVRLVRERSEGVTGGLIPAPTHVGDLDIRPDSLPADIGQAARLLWDRGERRAALSLLYRGLLSRLVHAHHVPIRDSTTEGDCLTLAARHLPQDRQDYVSRVLGVWQQFVYAGQDADTSVVHFLCAGFGAALDTPSDATLDSAAAKP